jgi:hypothetical protein
MFQRANCYVGTHLSHARERIRFHKNAAVFLASLFFLSCATQSVAQQNRVASKDAARLFHYLGRPV